VIGGDGQLGLNLASRLRKEGNHVLSTVFMNNQVKEDQLFLDLSKDIFDWQVPGPTDIAFFCAAITSLDKCRTQPEYSSKINVKNTLVLARRLSLDGAALFFPSSNLVFDGLVPFQKATDPLNPLCEYGRQKAETEQGLAELTERVAIVRFTKIISPGMTIIKNWIIDLQNGKTIHPFSDMVLSPVSLSFATDTIIAIMQRESYGTWQVSAREDITYEQMAMYLAEKMGVSQKLIEPIKLHQSGMTFETIPKHTTLDTSRLKEELGIEPPEVWNVLDEVLQ